MLHPTDLTPAAAVDGQPRARGVLRMSAKARDGLSVIETLHQAGSYKVVFPRQGTGAGLQAVTVNTAGGVTGGDRFDASFSAGAGTDLTVTTQAAERAYRAQPATFGSVTTQLTVAEDARLAWLPQETILFDGAGFARSMSVDLTGDGQLLFVEPLVFGRMSGGEVLTDVTFQDRVSVRRDGRLVFQDAVQLTGAVTAQMARRAAGAGALASVLYVAPDAEGALSDLRAALPRTGGASLLAPDILHVRLLADDSFTLRKTMMPVLERLSAAPLPRVWRI